jgi:hypothetical protein
MMPLLAAGCWLLPCCHALRACCNMPRLAFPGLALIKGGRGGAASSSISPCRPTCPSIPSHPVPTRQYVILARLPNCNVSTLLLSARAHPGPVVGNNAIMPYEPCDSLVRSPAVRLATTGTAARASVVKPHYRLLARRRRVVRTHALADYGGGASM